MTFNRDFSCELIGLIVLMALSAASHFWYVMIGMAMVAGLILIGIGLLAVFVRAKREYWRDSSALLTWNPPPKSPKFRRLRVSPDFS